MRDYMARSPHVHAEARCVGHHVVSCLVGGSGLACVLMQVLTELAIMYGFVGRLFSGHDI